MIGFNISNKMDDASLSVTVPKHHIRRHKASLSNTTTITKTQHRNIIKACLGQPKGFETRITDKGQIYFYHVATRSLTWYYPGIPKRMKKETGPLPLGWEKRSTSRGKPYFAHHKSRTTLYTDPRLIASLVENFKVPQSSPVVNFQPSNQVEEVENKTAVDNLCQGDSNTGSFSYVKNWLKSLWPGFAQPETVSETDELENSDG